MEQSPLLRLPAELRIKIYEYALWHKDGITIKPYLGKPSLSWLPKHNRPLALTSTCRQLRHESLPVFYSTSLFTLEHTPLFREWQAGEQQSSERALRHWAGVIGRRNRSTIQRVEIVLDAWDTCVTSVGAVYRTVLRITRLFDSSKPTVYIRFPTVSYGPRISISTITLSLGHLEQASSVLHQKLAQTTEKARSTMHPLNLAQLFIGLQYIRVQVETLAEAFEVSRMTQDELRAVKQSRMWRMIARGGGSWIEV